MKGGDLGRGSARRWGALAEAEPNAHNLVKRRLNRTEVNELVRLDARGP
jgi:hypothetical protein